MKIKVNIRLEKEEWQKVDGVLSVAASKCRFEDEELYTLIQRIRNMIPEQVFE